MQVIRSLIAFGVGVTVSVNASQASASPARPQPTDAQVNLDSLPAFELTQAPASPAPSPPSETPAPAPSPSATPSPPPETPSPSAAPSPPASTPPESSSPASQSAADLVPNPNPLYVPNQPLDVRIERTQGITQQQSLEIATRNNRQLQQTRLQLERARAVLREQQAALFPTLSTNAQVEYQRDVGNPANETAPLTGGVNFDYTVFDFGQRRYNIEVARDQVRQAELEVERLNQAIRLEISGFYYDLQNASEQVRINQAAVTASEQNLRDAQAQERAGVTTRFDTLQAQTQLANDQVNLLAAQNNQRVARRQIAQRLDVPQTVDLDAVDPIAVAGDWTMGLEDTILAAYASRVELQQQLLARQIAQNQARLAVTSLRPRFGLSGGYNFQYPLIAQTQTQTVQTAQGVQTVTSSLPREFQDALNVALTLQWTFFDGGAARAQVAQARADQAIAESEFANQRSQVRFDVENAFLTLQSQREQIAAARVGLNSAQEQLRLSRLRFQAGVGTQLEVVNSTRDLTQAESSLSQAVIGYNRALAQLQRSVSNL